MSNLKNNKQYLKALKDKVMSIFSGRSQGLAPVNLSKQYRQSVVIDTETIGDITKGEKAFPYDISFIRFVKNQLLEKISYINSDIFDDEYKMSSAFYRNKIPFYKEKLKTDRHYKKAHDIEILEALNDYIVKHKIKYFLAFNVKFDYNSINNLYNMKKLNKKIKNQFEKLRVIDIWKIATDMLEMFPSLYESYMLFCYNNNYITESGLNVKTSAEIFNRFVNNDTTFIENHTGLEDTICEYNILLKLLWYYKTQTGEDYYYKLDSVFTPQNHIFKGGIFNVSNIPPILKKHGIKE